MYYYTYYLLSRFAKRYNNKDGDFAFTAIFYYIALFGMNIMTLLMLLVDKIYFKTHLVLMIAVAVIVPAFIHYFGLIKDRKYLDVIDNYDAKIIDTSLRKGFALRLITYVVISIVSMIAIAVIVRRWTTS